MNLLYRLAADFVVALHVAYVAFVILGFVAIWAGIVRRRSWARNPVFRYTHLAAIGIVVAESLLGLVCPLTIWEQRLRELAGQTAYHGDFVARWLHDLIFFEAEPWIFTVIYTLFGLLVLATFVVAPPRRTPPQGSPCH
jgi:hypothetical protein